MKNRKKKKKNKNHNENGPTRVSAALKSPLNECVSVAAEVSYSVQVITCHA